MKKIMIMIAAAAMMASCCNKAGEAVSLEGKWTIATVNGEEITLEEMPFLEFNTTDNKFHGNAGVNIMNGEYTQEGEKLVFGEAATTMMAGRPEANKIERAILDNIAKVAVAAEAEEKVELRDAEDAVLMTLVKTLDIEGKWTIAAVNGEEIKLEAMPFIEFQGARFHGNAGVNIFNGSFRLAGTALELGEAATTMMAGEEAESTVERAILDVFAKVASVKAIENGLELLDAEGKVVLLLNK